MEAFTTEPGVQLYTGNHVRDFVGTDGARFGPHGGFCLETQHCPDSPNKPAFPSTVLRPGQTFNSTTIYKFSATTQP
jgi:aldose 1-epimerase